VERQGVLGVKLKDGEARHLAALIVAVARPRSAAEAEEVQQWVKRLTGGR
jgi:hypothetical protein